MSQTLAFSQYHQGGQPYHQTAAMRTTTLLQHKLSTSGSSSSSCSSGRLSRYSDTMNNNVSSSGALNAINNFGVRKQVLPLKQKNQSNVYVQRLEHKSKTRTQDEVSVTTLELKKKKPTTYEHKTVTNLVYRKPSTRDVEVISPNGDRRPASPTSSGYGTDGVIDFEHQENEFDTRLMLSNLIENSNLFCELCYGAAARKAQLHGQGVPSMIHGPWTDHKTAFHFSSLPTSIDSYSLFMNPFDDQLSTNHRFFQ